MPEQFTREEVERIARLARLDLAGDEQDLLARQLGDILAYVQQIQDVDTAGIAPTAHALIAELPMRDDEARPSLSREDAVAAAPKAAAGLFKVPRVLG